MIPGAPKGTDDVLPPQSERWRTLLRVFDDMAEQYGYGLVMTPLFEATGLFSRGVGEATEIVEKQMYTFDDKAGRSLTLRPEATASVVRAYLQAGMQGVFKGSYSGPMFRYEQPQAGRRRQFYQVGVEYLGEVSPDADVEVIEFGYRLLEEVGITGVTVLLNSIGALTWDYVWWSARSPWLIFLFGYLHFFLVSFWVFDMETVRKKAITVGAIFAFDILLVILFGVILHWI